MLLTKPLLKKVVEICRNKFTNPDYKPKTKPKTKPDDVNKKKKLKINVLKRLPASDILKVIYTLKEKKVDFYLE
jgi:hypothetical protein